MIRLSYELGKQLHEIAGWPGPTTQRQLLVWMAWLPVEKAKIEFQPIQRKPSLAPPDPKFVLTKEKIRDMQKKARIHGIVGGNADKRASAAARVGIAGAIAGVKAQAGTTIFEPR